MEARLLAQDLLQWLSWADCARLSRVNTEWRGIILAHYAASQLPLAVAFANEYMLAHHRQLIHPTDLVQFLCDATQSYGSYWTPENIDPLFDRVALLRDGQLEHSPRALRQLWAEMMIIDKPEWAQSIPARDWSGSIICRRTLDGVRNDARELAECSHELTKRRVPKPGRQRRGGYERDYKERLSHVKVTPTIRVLAAVWAARRSMRKVFAALLYDMDKVELRVTRALMALDESIPSWIQFDNMKRCEDVSLFNDA